MRRFIVISVLIGVLSLLFTSAALSDGFSAPAEQQRLVRLTRYEGRPITGVSASFGFDVHLVQSAQTRVVAEISEQLEQYLDLSLGADGIVRVSLNIRNGSRSMMPRNAVLKLTVFLPALASLSGSGGADFTATGAFQSPRTTISLSGGADLRLPDIQADVLEVRASGGADAVLAGRADELMVHVSGGADAELNVSCSTAQVHVSGGSDLELQGEATQATFAVSGGGDLDARNFAAKRLRVSASGAGNASVWAVDELRATASSASDIRYRGHPAVLENRSSSAGSVRRIND